MRLLASSARTHFTLPGLLLAISMAFTLTGGAYAASRYLITSTTQISPAVLAQLRAQSGSSTAPISTADEPLPGGRTLPAHTSETGVWGLALLPGSFAGGVAQLAYAQLSFPEPLRERLTPSHVHILEPGEEGTGGSGCPTGATLDKPAAEPRNLCIFQGEHEINVNAMQTFDPATEEEGASGEAGTLLEVKPDALSEPVRAYGTWAVAGR